jgi:hypothetical protein
LLSLFVRCLIQNLGELGDKLVGGIMRAIEEMQLTTMIGRNLRRELRRGNCSKSSWSRLERLDDHAQTRGPNLLERASE